MLKRVGLQSSKKVPDTEKQQPLESEAAACSNGEVKDGVADDRKSLDSGQLQWCDLLSFRNVCAVGTADSGSGCSAGNIGNQLGNDDPVVRRSRRSRVFNFHYLDLHIMEFKPRAITRRLCGGKKPDNELYRSNSFKFERFERIDDGSSLQKQVSLCDEYSLPVDFVNKRRPHSFGAGLANWTTPSPNGEQVEIIETYCDPRDSKAYLEPGDEASAKLYTSPDKDYSQPYTTDGSSEAKTPEDEDDGVYEDVGLPEDHPTASAIEVTGNCVTVIHVGESEEHKQAFNELEQNRVGEADEYQLTVRLTAAAPVTATRRNPSPYYYGDLFHDNYEPQIPRRHYTTRQQVSQPRKSVSFDTPGTAVLPNHNSLHGDGSPSVSSLILSEVSPCSGSQHAAGSAGSLLAACLLEWDAILMPPHRQLRGQHDLPSVCACAGAGQCLDEDDEVDDVGEYDNRNRHLHRHQYLHYPQQQRNGGAPVEEPPVDYNLPEDGEDEYGYDMSGRQRHVYETAFDCKVSRSDDDLDDVDRVTNHPVLQMFGTNKVSSSTNTGSSLARPVRASSSQDPTVSVGVFTPKERRKVTLVRGKLVKERPKGIPSRLLLSDTASSTTTLSQDFDGLEIDDSEDVKPEPSPPLPLRGYSPSPPSTAPLPAKFHGNNKDILAMNSIRSAPNLPSTSPAHPRLKDMRLPVKSLRARELPDSRKGSIMEFKGRPRSLVHQDENVPDFKGRPRSMFVEGGGPILEFKGRPNDAEKLEQPILEFKGRPGRSEKNEGSVLDFSGRQRGLVSQESDSILEFKGRPVPGNRRCGVRPKYSSTESMATSSSGGSLESIRSSTSEGNRSTTSSESHRSSSLSSHSSDSACSSGGGGNGSGQPSSNTHHLHHYCHHHHHHHHQCSGAGTPLGVVSGGRFFAHQSNKLHILSPISDKSSQEPVSETSDNNRNNNSQKASPEETDHITSPISTTKVPTTDSQPWGEPTGIKMKRRAPQNKNLINLTLQQQSSSSGEAEIQGSDSGISIESRGGTKCTKLYNLTGFSFTKQANNADNNESADNELQTADFSDLPFDMPKLRRRRLLQQDTCTSGSATSVDIHDLPFDMPKLRRRLRGQPPVQQQPQTSTESSGVSQASSSQSVRDADRPVSSVVPSRPSLTLNLEAASSPKQRLGLSLNLGGSSFVSARGDSIDVQLPLERQGWYHGAITRVEAENVLRLLKEGSYLVRNSESTRQDYSLSLKSARGFMHMRIQQCPETGKFILGQFSKPFDNIPEMIHHYTVNRLPIRGAEHMCLLHPVIEQLL